MLRSVVCLKKTINSACCLVGSTLSMLQSQPQRHLVVPFRPNTSSGGVQKCSTHSQHPGLPQQQGCRMHLPDGILIMKKKDDEH